MRSIHTCRGGWTLAVLWAVHTDLSVPPTDGTDRQEGVNYDSFLSVQKVFTVVSLFVSPASNL